MILCERGLLLLLSLARESLFFLSGGSTHPEARKATNEVNYPSQSDSSKC